MKVALMAAVLLSAAFPAGEAQTSGNSSAFGIARLKYAGGGDWYNDPSAEVNLLSFVQRTTGIETDPRYRFVDIAGDGIYSSPFLFLTGHGNIAFSDTDVRRLSAYLENGGFLYGKSVV